MSTNELTLRTGVLPVDRALISTEAPMESLLGLDVEGYAIVMDSEVHHRIVTCVNACMGIETSWLDGEQGLGYKIVGLRNDLTRCAKDRDEARAMSNELLEALKDARDMLTSHPDFQEAGSLDLYDKAIAKAEGQS